MKALRFVTIALLSALLMGGCKPRFKSIESMQSAVTPDSTNPGQGDKYTYGGAAEASGGVDSSSSRASTKPKIGK